MTEEQCEAVTDENPSVFYNEATSKVLLTFLSRETCT